MCPDTRNSRIGDDGPASAVQVDVPRKDYGDIRCYCPLVVGFVALLQGLVGDYAEEGPVQPIRPVDLGSCGVVN